MPIDVGIMPILDQAATINMALSRNGCVMPRELSQSDLQVLDLPEPVRQRTLRRCPGAEESGLQESRYRVHDQTDRRVPRTGYQRYSSVRSEQMERRCRDHQRIRYAYDDLIV